MAEEEGNEVRIKTVNESTYFQVKAKTLAWVGGILFSAITTAGGFLSNQLLKVNTETNEKVIELKGEVKELSTEVKQLKEQELKSLNTTVMFMYGQLQILTSESSAGSRSQVQPNLPTFRPPVVNGN